MLLSIKVPDEIYEAYGKHNPNNPRLAMEQALARFAKITPNKKAIVITGESLSKVQTLLNGVFESDVDLLAALVKALCINVEGVEVSFTESQRKAIQDACAYFKMDPKEFTAQKVKEGLFRAFGV